MNFLIFKNIKLIQIVLKLPESDFEKVELISARNSASDDFFLIDWMKFEFSKFLNLFKSW